MTYRGFDIKWRVFDYDTENESEHTVKIFADAAEAATFCIDHSHAGVEMIAFPIKKGGVKA